MSKPAGKFTVTVRGKRDAAAQRVIMRGLHAYNDTKIGRWPFRNLAVLVRSPRGVVKGGLFGMIYWGWLFVNYFWLDEELRGKDWGTRCLATAESEALRHGCHGVWLDTGSFQAPGFYRKQGYKRFGFLQGHPPGAGHFWFFKRLKSKRPQVAKFAKPSLAKARPKRKPARRR